MRLLREESTFNYNSGWSGTVSFPHQGNRIYRSGAMPSNEGP